MRVALLFGILLLATPLLPSAPATHFGPCTHEWFEIVAYAASTGDVYTSAGYAAWCAGTYAETACRVLRCREIIA